MKRRAWCGSAAKAGIVTGVGWLMATGQPTRLDAQQSPTRLDTLTVAVGSRASGSVSARTRALEVIGRDRLAALPVRTVSEALRLAVGVDIQSRSPAQSDVSLRGSSFEQVVVLVDGVRMSDAMTGHFDLDLTVPLTQVERIEILRGAASALHGADAVGGVINVVTKEPGSRPAGEVEGGSFSQLRLSGSGGFGESGSASVAPAASAGVEYARSDGHRRGTEYDIVLGHGRVALPAGPGRLSISLGHARRDFGANGFYAPFTSYEETRTNLLWVRWEGALGRGWSIEPRVSLRHHDDDFILDRDDPTFSRNMHEALRPGGEVIARWSSAGGAVSFATGAEAYREDLESTNLGDRAEDRAALFSEAAWSDDRTAAALGLRLDAHENFGPSLSPSVSASYRPGDRVRLRTAAGRSFRIPTFIERYFDDPAHTASAELDPERTWSAEVGIDVELPRATLLRVTGFRRWTRDLVDWSKPVSSPESQWVTRNVESANFTGLELSVQGTVPGDVVITGGGSVLSVDASESEGFFSKQVLRPLTRRVSLGGARRFGDRLTLSTQLIHQRRKDEPDFTVVDLRAAVVVPGGELYLDLTNVGDREYLDLTGNDAQGRAVLIGFRAGG